MRCAVKGANLQKRARTRPGRQGPRPVTAQASPADPPGSPRNTAAIPSVLLNAEKRDVTAKAAAVASELPGDNSELVKTIKIGGSILAWFALNAVFAIYNKKTLNCFPYPWILSWIQIATGAVLMLFLWGTKLYKGPEGGLTWPMCKALVPTATLHLIAHVSACASYNLSSVSFMQVVKAAEPVCSVVLLTACYSARFSPWVWLSLVPIVLGVAVGSVSEFNFSVMAFVLAMMSNVACAVRGVTSKALQADLGLKGVNLYAAIAIVSSVLLLPLALAVEGGSLVQAFQEAGPAYVARGYGTAAAGFLPFLMVGSVLYHSYNQSSYMALADVSPLTHSVANTVKRVVIILASVAVFQNPITPVGAASAAVAIGGTFLYSIARRAETEAAKAKEEETCGLSPKKEEPLC